MSRADLNTGFTTQRRQGSSHDATAIPHDDKMLKELLWCGQEGRSFTCRVLIVIDCSRPGTKELPHMLTPERTKTFKLSVYFVVRRQMDQKGENLFSLQKEGVPCWIMEGVASMEPRWGGREGRGQSGQPAPAESQLPFLTLVRLLAVSSTGVGQAAVFPVSSTGVLERD